MGGVHGWRTPLMGGVHGWRTSLMGGVQTGVHRQWVAYRLVYTANGWRTDWCTPIMGGVQTGVHR